MAIEVTLTFAELLVGATIGINRHIRAIVRKQPDAYGATALDNGWQRHIEGACGELAAAKVKNLYWSASIDTFKNGGDVGNVQVRTRSRLEYDLIVREDDRDEDTFVLVTGQAPSYLVHGMILGREAKKEEFKETYGGRPAAYFVPKDRLEALHAGGV